MIAKEFQDFLQGQLDDCITPAEELAIFIDSHNADHVMLLLVSNGLSRVPVITKDKLYVGTISMADIASFQREEGLSERQLATSDIALMTSSKLATVRPDADLTEIMHKLVDAAFLPVVEESGLFVGIITRKTILKALNSLLHDFSNEYSITEHD